MSVSTLLKTISKHYLEGTMRNKQIWYLGFGLIVSVFALASLSFANPMVKGAPQGKTGVQSIDALEDAMSNLPPGTAPKGNVAAPKRKLSQTWTIQGKVSGSVILANAEGEIDIVEDGSEIDGCVVKFPKLVCGKKAEALKKETKKKNTKNSKQDKKEQEEKDMAIKILKGANERLAGELALCKTGSLRSSTKSEETVVTATEPAKTNVAAEPSIQIAPQETKRSDNDQETKELRQKVDELQKSNAEKDRLIEQIQKEKERDAVRKSKIASADEDEVAFVKMLAEAGKKFDITNLGEIKVVMVSDYALVQVNRENKDKLGSLKTAVKKEINSNTHTYFLFDKKTLFSRKGD